MTSRWLSEGATDDDMRVLGEQDAAREMALERAGLRKPYYQQDGVTIYHGDAREILPILACNSVDAILTDPPFFMPATHYQSRVDWQRGWSDTSVLAAFWATILDLSVPILKSTGHFVSFCNGDSYPVFYPEMYRRFDFLKCLVWDKQNVGLGRVWRNQHELVIAARWNESEFVEDGQLRADVFQFKATHSADRYHPVEKPTAMLAWLLRPIVPQGGAVLDPFMGGASTLLAASALGFRATGIEGEERYCAIAVERLRQAVLPLEPAPEPEQLNLEGA